MIHPVQRLIIPSLLKLWLKEVCGKENVPLDGRFIVTPNHQSFLDDWIPSSIIVPTLNKELHMYVNRKFFKNALFRWYLNNHESIPVEVYKGEGHKKINEEAFKKAIGYLENGEPICIYPEGHRSIDGELQKAKLGAAKLALRARVPVLPFGIIGSREAFPKGTYFPKIRRVVKVKIGKPIFFDRYYGKQDDIKVLSKVTNIIMNEIGKLIGKGYKY